MCPLERAELDHVPLLSVTALVCPLQRAELDHGVLAVGYGTGLVSLMVHVGFKDVLPDGELCRMPAFCQHPVFRPRSGTSSSRP